MATRHAKVAQAAAMQASADAPAQAACNAGMYLSEQRHVLHDGVLYAPGQAMRIDDAAAQRLGLIPVACATTETQIAQE